MQSVELTAKSVAEATTLAAEKLGVSPDKVTITVLEESKGLFGKTTVRVRADVQEGKEEAPKKAPKKPATKAVAEVETAEEEPAPKAEKPSRSKPAKKEAAPAKAADSAPEGDSEEQEGDAEVVASQKDADDLVDLVNHVLGLGNLQARAQFKSLNGRYVNLELDGKDVAYLVGKHGEVLNNLQYLINVLANKTLTAGVRVTIDGNNYRSRREEALTALAQDIAAQVIERQEEAVLDALPAFERRVVHRAVAELVGISTYSEGEEPNRRIVIAPAAK